MRKLALFVCLPLLLAALPSPPQDDKLSVPTTLYMHQLYEELKGESGKVGSFTRDTALAGGTQSIDGVGFRPSRVIFFLAEASSTGEVSWGLDALTTRFCLVDNSGIAANGYGYYTSYSLADNEGVGAAYLGKITSMDTDGFTITWTKQGAPTGTLGIGYMAFP